MCTRLMPTPEELAALTAELDAKYAREQPKETTPLVRPTPIRERTDVDESQAA